MSFSNAPAFNVPTVYRGGEDGWGQDPNMGFTPIDPGENGDRGGYKNIYVNDPKNGSVGYWSAQIKHPDENGMGGGIIPVWHGSQQDFTGLTGGDVTADFYGNNLGGTYQDKNGLKFRYDPISDSFQGIDPQTASGWLKNNPDAYYSTLGTQLKDEILGAWSMAHDGATAEQKGQLEAIKSVNPKAYYEAQLGLLGGKMGWNAGQNTSDRNAEYQKAVQDMLPEMLSAGVGTDKINSLLNTSYSTSARANQQYIANKAASGGSFFKPADLAFMGSIALAGLTAGVSSAFTSALAGTIGSSAASVVAPALLGSAASAGMAALTGGDVGKAALTGAIGGGVGGAVNTLGVDAAAKLVGGGDAIMGMAKLSEVANSVGMTTSQVSGLVSSAISTELSGLASGVSQDKLLERITNNLGATALGNYAGNLTASISTGDLTKAANAVAAVTKIGVNSALNGQDLQTSLTNNIGQIIGAASQPTKYTDITKLFNSDGSLSTSGLDEINKETEPAKIEETSKAADVVNPVTNPVNDSQIAGQSQTQAMAMAQNGQSAEQIAEQLKNSFGFDSDTALRYAENAVSFLTGSSDAHAGALDSSGRPVKTAAEAYQDALAAGYTPEEAQQYAYGDSIENIEITGANNPEESGTGEIVIGTNPENGEVNTMGGKQYVGDVIDTSASATPATPSTPTQPTNPETQAKDKGAIGSSSAPPSPITSVTNSDGSVTTYYSDGTSKQTVSALDSGQSTNQTTATGSPAIGGAGGLDSIGTSAGAGGLDTISGIGTTDNTGAGAGTTGTGTGTGTTAGTGTGGGGTGTGGTGTGGTGTGTGTGGGGGGGGAGTGGGGTGTGGYQTWSQNYGQDQYGGITNLTPGLTKANQDYTLAGQPMINEDMTQIPQFATGGYTGITDLNDPSNKSSSGLSAALTPGLTKAQLNYILTGLQGLQGPAPVSHADGGAIEGHNPTFFSEGGLGSIENRYAKGEGDGTSDEIPAMLAHSEFVIPADVVSSLGNGSSDAGAKILDEFLRTIREHKRSADAKELPPDSKGALGYLLEAKKKVKS